MAQQYSTNEFKAGLKVEIDGQPYTIVTNQFVKPGKAQPFNRVRLKHLISGRVIERTFKSGDKVDEADVVETKMRLLYRDGDDLVLMDDETFEQSRIPVSAVGETEQWLKDDIVYDIIIYKGNPINVEPPTFMELEVTETEPGLRGDTSGRVMKGGRLETGAKVQLPLFIEVGEVVRFDTRTGEYVSRVN